MNTPAHSAAVAALCILLTSPRGAQTVHVVDASGGAGSSFTTIGAAVAAASEGDLVLVRGGLYAESVTLDGKSLDVQAETGSNVRVQGITVRNLAANQHASFRGIGRGSSDLALTLEDDLGPVWIEDLGSSLVLFYNVTAVVSDCSTVVLRDCTFKPLNLQPAVDLTNTSVALYGCVLEGYDAGSSPFAINGTAGLSTIDSAATLYASSVVGGRGSNPVFGGSPGQGGPGCALSTGSVLDVIGSSVQGGAGGTGGSSGPAFATFGGSVVNQLPNLAHSLSSPSPVREGATTSLTLTGHPADRAYVLVGLVPGHYMTSPVYVGPLVTAPQRFLVPMGVLPASGTMTLSLNVAPIAGEFSSLYLQGLFLGAGEISLGSAAQVFVLDSAF